MNTQLPEQSTQESDAAFVGLDFLVYPDCQILDVCGPFEAFYFADLMLGLLGRTKEPELPVPCSGDRSGTRPDHVRVGDRRDSSLR